jgi:maltose/moltooligosaccharide transporter
LAVQHKPRLTFWGIAQMNLGFLGLQFSFGLQQANMTPIYKYLGADEATTPLLWLAGPMTGLIVQPIVGAMSDRTTSRLGRRTPYFLIGAVLCSLALFAMPYSPALWVAASLLWILDAANNVTMEPYRAYVSDRLDETQRPLGFLTQSAFTGLAQTLSYLAPSIFVGLGMNPDLTDENGIPQVTRIAFVIGAVLSISTIVWSVWRVPELSVAPEELARMRAEPRSVAHLFRELADAIRQMPPAMRQLGLAMLFQWYGMFCYWQFVALSLARSIYGDSGAAAVRDAALINGRLGGFFNAVAFVAALALVPVTRRLGAKSVHAACMVASGVAMLLIPQVRSEAWGYLPMIGIGLGWASLMGNPYVMLAGSIPPARTGVYMGVFNMFIVVPMLIESVTMWLLYGPVLGGDPRNVLLVGGGCMIAAGAATMLVQTSRRDAPSALLT